MRNITMRNTFRHITAIIAIALLGSTAMTSWAQKTYTDEEKAAIKTKKQVIDNGDGSYQLKLETFVTGETSNLYQKVTTNSKPMDIVLVLDVSGSMEYSINSPADTSARSSQAYTYNGYGNSQYYYRDTDGKYYRVRRETYNTDDGYNPLANTEYSYNTYGTHQYYYRHTDGKYYLVERTSDSVSGKIYRRRRLKFNVNGTTWYLSGTTATTQAPDNVTSDNGKIWTGVLYEKVTTVNYTLQYTANGTTHYLSGTTSSTTQKGVANASDPIWTGVLYEISAAGQISKMDAVKKAVNAFIDSVAAKSDATNPNRIAIVKFAGTNSTAIGNSTYREDGYTYNYSQRVDTLKNATLDTKSEIKDKINSLNPGGATSADYGMNHAATTLSQLDTNVRKGLVIMFTDGEPNHSSGFSKTVAETTITKSKELKDKGITVYTVGTFDNETTNIRTYMNRTSSNYPNATGMDNGEAGTQVDDKYYILAQNASKIAEAFASITRDIPNGTTGGWGIDLDVEGENAVHLADIVTSSFKVPQGNSSVTLKMQFLDTLDLHHPADTSAFVWRDEVDVPEEVKVSVIENQADTTSTIDITGFDFSANWVGPIFKKTIVGQDTTTNYTESSVKHGAKLVIYVDIIPNPDAVGGLVPTNTNKSGVYVGGVLITNGKLQDYITPEPVFTPMDLKIEIEGLGENENAIFNVKGGDLGENGMNIILTSTTEGSIASATIAKVPLNDAEGNPITYTVTLDKKWIWAYTPAEATDAPAGDKNYKTTEYTVKEHALYNAEVDAEGKITSYTTNHIFKFKVTPREGVSGHGENFKNNEFKIMPKNAATK